jgi:hypothetical protein
MKEKQTYSVRLVAHLNESVELKSVFGTELKMTKKKQEVLK